jgi:hypothetical protein
MLTRREKERIEARRDRGPLIAMIGIEAVGQTWRDLRPGYLIVVLAEMEVGSVSLREGAGLVGIDVTGSLHHSYT